MTALPRNDIGESALRDQPRVVLVAGPRRVRLPMVQALGVCSDLRTRSSPSIRDLLNCGAGGHQLVVAHCDSVAPEDAAVFKQLKSTSPELLIVAVCGSPDRRAVRRLIDCGVDGLVLFDQLEAALAPTVAAVFAGQVVVPRDLRVSLDKPALSPREREILSMVVMGLSNQEISSQMFLAESTVKSHLSSAYNKLGVRSRGEAAALILDRNGSLSTGIVANGPNTELRAA